MRDFTKEEIERIKEVAVELEIEKCLADPRHLERLVRKDMYWLWMHHYIERLEQAIPKKDIAEKLGFDIYD